MRRIDEEPSEAFLKAAIYGPPGTGKTDFSVSAPRPLILLSERQGMATVRAAAKRRGVPMPAVLYMEKLEDYRDVLRALHGPRDAAFRVSSKGANGERATVYEGAWPETVVLDSLSDACELVEAEIRAEAPPERAKDGLEKWTERHWSALRDRCEKLIRAFRDAPLHVLFLALQDDRMVGEGEEASRQVNPSLPMRALPGVLCASVNVVGITSRRIDERGEDGQRVIVHEVRTLAPSHYMVKPFRPLRDVEVPDFSDWVRRVRESHATPSTTPPERPRRRAAQASTPTTDGGAA